MHCQSRDREGCREYPPSEFINRLRSRRNLQRRTEKPVRDRVDRVLERTLGRGSLNDLGRVDIGLYYATRSRLQCRFRHLFATRSQLLIDEIQRTLAQDLVRDADATVLGVVRLRKHRVRKDSS